MRWFAIVPLIGGQVLGTEQAVGKEAEVFYSFPEFTENESYLMAYRPKVRRTELNSGVAVSAGPWDLAVSTCPCAGLSMLSPFKADDPRRAKMNSWMIRTTDHVLEHARPRVLLGENAPQLISRMGESVRTELERLAHKHGYGLTIIKLSSTVAGLPQHRSRCFYIFTRGGTPSQHTLELVTQSERAINPSYLAGYLTGVTGREDDESFPFNLVVDPTYVFLKERFGSRWRNAGGQNKRYSDALHIMIDQNLVGDFNDYWTDTLLEGWCRDLPRADANTARGQVRMMRRLAAKKAQDPTLGVYAQTPILPRTVREVEGYPALTAKTTERLVHPLEERYLTYREAAHLMGLPGDMKLPPAKRFNVICQNVPVPTAAYATRVALRLGERATEPVGSVRYDALLNRPLRDRYVPEHQRGGHVVAE